MRTRSWSHPGVDTVHSTHQRSKQLVDRHGRDATPGLHRLGENKVWVCCLTCLILIYNSLQTINNASQGEEHLHFLLSNFTGTHKA